MMRPHSLILDVSNLLYRAYYANPNEQADIVMGLAMHGAFLTINKYFKMAKPDKVVMAFDRKNWREEYTKSDACYSKRIYKGERRIKDTPAQKAKYNAFRQHIVEFEDIMRQHTTVVALAADGLEGDDCIAAWVTRNPDHNHTIVSGDRDFVQLLKYPNVILVDPATGKQRTHEDPLFYMFEKCFRGEPATTDNVQSAYPKLRTQKIEAAYKDPIAYTNLRMTKWTHIDGREMEVGKLLDENRLLMDLTAQPDYIQDIMDEMVAIATVKKRKFSHFHFLKFLGKYELREIAKQLETFVPMLSR